MIKYAIKSQMSGEYYSGYHNEYVDNLENAMLYNSLLGAQTIWNMILKNDPHNHYKLYIVKIQVDLIDLGEVSYKED